MYVMIYSWPEAISSARPWGSANVDPPFGIIFACFMSSFTLGSLFFAHVTRAAGNSRQLSISLVQLSLSLSALSFIVVVASPHQYVRFLAFCIFEFCVGVYFPSIAYLRGHFVRDTHRATIYGIIRVPLNAFVFVSLISIHEGARSINPKSSTCLLPRLTFRFTLFSPNPPLLFALHPQANNRSLTLCKYI